MNKLFVSIGLAFVVAAWVLVPGLHEDWISQNLDLTFEVFKGVTVENYPDKVDRETAFAKVLAEKALIVKENSWPLMACEATFTARNPGTIHRKNVRAVSCSWGS